MNTVRTALIGAGHLGTYHAEKLFQIENSRLVAICDPLLEKAQKLAQKYSCQAHPDFKNITQEVDAVLIATPTPLHFEIAQFFLENGKHIFIEKPMTQTMKQGEHLCQLAKDKNLVLQVGHVERFNPAFIKAKENLGKTSLKTEEILFIEARRLAPFKPNNIDVDVILDLMIHDIDLILNLVNSPVVCVSAVGYPVITPHVDIANVHLEFESGVVANITASRVSPSKIRQLQIFQKQGSLSIDFNSVEVSLFKINPDSTTQKEPQAGLSPKTKLSGLSGDPKEGKPQTLRLPKGDALLSEDRAFINSIQKSQAPVVSGKQALAAMKVVEQIHEQIS